MSILGKILILLNLLIATAFVYLAVSDWVVRYSWSYAVFRQDLVLDGLPLDEQESDARDGFVIAEQLSDATLEDVFRSVGNPVRTQAEEARGLKELVLKEEEAATDNAAKRKVFLEALLPLANTTGQRAALREHIDKAPIDDLRGNIKELFDEVEKLEIKLSESDPERVETYNRKLYAQPVESGGAKYSLVDLLPRDRRRAFAHLFFSVHPKSAPENIRADQIRTLIVIGMKAFTEELNQRAKDEKVMIEHLRLALLGDRAGFEVEYRAMLIELRDRADMVDDRKLDLLKQQELHKTHTALTAGRKADVEQANDNLLKARQTTAALLVKQGENEEILFKDQRFLGGAKLENERLERLIRSLEGVRTRP